MSGFIRPVPNPLTRWLERNQDNSWSNIPMSYSTRLGVVPNVQSIEMKIFAVAATIGYCSDWSLFFLISNEMGRDSFGC